LVIAPPDQNRLYAVANHPILLRGAFSMSSGAMEQVMIRIAVLAAVAGLLFCRAAPVLAQNAPMASQCTAVANAMPEDLHTVIIKAAWSTPVQADAPLVTITYAGHSTFVIETPGGVRIATDFSGAFGDTPLPRVVTMNKAHSTHYTLVPDPGIEHVLTGWNPEGGPAKHAIVIDDVYIRNVTTDIRNGAAMERDGNSIFIFETAGLCIGHLGHLHHPLSDAHYAAIGRLDVVMVPVDGGLTLSHESIGDIVKRLRSSLVLPMHRRFTSIESFLERAGEGFEIRRSNSDAVTVSLTTLPKVPTILMLRGL
jgi:L-ascorbate metabolism protein UlaG (beta-lactamase superfamily)